MRKKVVVIGGGVAGLTAAHELVDRGFDVTVYEQREYFGGKAASTNNGSLPGEHGFRFFPGWYQHVPDTMKRIPYGQEASGGGRRSVYQNLVSAQTNYFASYYRDPIPALVRFPRSWADLKTALSFPQRLLELKIPNADIRFFIGKLLQFAMTPETERVEKYDGQTWWKFMEGDSDQHSQPYRDYLVDGLTRNTIAADPKVASAYTIGHVALRTLFDVLRPEGIDRVLNGPTTAVWIEPWVSHLKARGVDFVKDAELSSIEIEASSIKHVLIRTGEIERRRIGAELDAIQMFRQLYARALRERTEEDRQKHALQRLARQIVGDEPLEGKTLEARLGDVHGRWTSEVLGGRGQSCEETLRSELEKKSAADAPGLIDSLKHASLWFEESYRTLWDQYESSLAGAPSKPVEADYFVFALPVEQMAFYVHRSEMLRRRDPDLANIISLSEQVGWMAGVQFYLTENASITPGHIDCIDTEWSLTAISQTQFWSDTHLSPLRDKPSGTKVKAVISVDISSWSTKGALLNKEAYACTRREIAREVWHQLKRSLNRPNQLPVLYDGMLLGSTEPNEGDRGQPPLAKSTVPDQSFHLDDNIVNRFDRKKQGFYKKFESVQFSPEALQAAQKQVGQGMPALETSFAFGDRLELNAEPLLINRVNSLALRPGVSTRISNMFLAADYVRTSTNLATMEGANEAARMAVNEILSRSGSNEEPCRLWQWQPSDVLGDVQSLLQYPEGAIALEYAATPFRFAAGAASKMTDLATRALARVTDRRK